MELRGATIRSGKVGATSGRLRLARLTGHCRGGEAVVDLDCRLAWEINHFVEFNCLGWGS